METKEKIDDFSTNTDPEWYGAEYVTVEDSGTAHISILSPNGDYWHYAFKLCHEKHFIYKVMQCQ